MRPVQGDPTSHDPLKPVRPEGMGMGALLAGLAHLVLIGALALGVNWRSSEPQGVQAELWAATPEAAAPRAAAPEPPPPPEPPAPTPTPPPPPPRPAPKPPEALPDAQIAIEKAKREEKLKLARAEEVERDKREAQQKAEAEKRKEELAKAQKKLEAEKLAQQKRAEDDKRKAAAEAQAQQARLDQARQENLQRLMAQAGTGSPSSTGTAAQSSGPSSSYAGRIKARIVPNIVFAEALAGNPTAEVEVKLAPDGRILSQKLLRSSGVGEWDAAVQRAIERTEALPRDVDGRVPASMVISFRPKD